jgi:hypothetical protein
MAKTSEEIASKAESRQPTSLSQATPQSAKDIPLPDRLAKSREDIELEQALEGFRDVAPDKADGWFQPAPGAYVLGRLLGRFTMTGGRKKPRAFYQIRVKQCGAPKTSQNPNGDVFMVSGKGDDATTLPIQKGATLAMDERKAFEILAGYADSDGVFDVFVRFIEKVDVAGGEQTFWRCEIRTKQLKAPKHPIRASSARASDDDDDIPF